MAINRKSLVESHNPVLKNINTASPFSVGNGEVAFTVDVTGLQSLYSLYKKQNVPLCTMSQWGWHSSPDSNGKFYTFDDVVKTEYDFASGKKVYYASKKKSGNEEVYTWLRQNPHRMNLAEIGFLLDEKPIQETNLSQIKQTLRLYDGIIESSFHLKNIPVEVYTAVTPDNDTIICHAKSELIKSKRLTLKFHFPYGGYDISGEGECTTGMHLVEKIHSGKNLWVIKNICDKDAYYVYFYSRSDFNVRFCDNDFFVDFSLENVSFSITFKKNECDYSELKKKYDFIPISIEKVFKKTKKWWNKFWQEGGAIKLSNRKKTEKSADFNSASDNSTSLANELERRLVLSQYLLAINCSGSMPPQETGLMCNSWHGKFHLEMHPLHMLWSVFWNRSYLLERSLPWYQNHLEQAKNNASSNGFKGARWPKQVAYNGIDSPSPISVLLIWQQPHIIFMLESLYNVKNAKEKKAFLIKYWDLIRETADFMADYAVFNQNKNCYELTGPLIPVQEDYDECTVKNPSFELCSWKKGLEIACTWAFRLGNKVPERWSSVSSNLTLPPMEDGLYTAHENCHDTFSNHAKDHPSMLFGYSFFADKNLKAENVLQTLEKVMSMWDYKSMWGWDFAMLAMCAERLQKTSLALDFLLCNSEKNTYEINGNNYQKSRDDLPAYFPGNGALLLAAAMIFAGFNKHKKAHSKFFYYENLVVEVENVLPLFT